MRDNKRLGLVGTGSSFFIGFHMIKTLGNLARRSLDLMDIARGAIEQLSSELLEFIRDHMGC